ncbi:acyl-CoA thioesterase [Microbacterium indicum]|uniref:acyl-CoA thioesterase n=1 Tax=Microbacterium indicum TaxID=358100 RepID=UPI0003F8CACC|nr:thioesterase family protein [Microbacterium indicum]
MTHTIDVPIHLRWGDQDAFGHINNVQAMRILEEARLRAFWVHEDPARSYDAAVIRPDLRVGDEGPYFVVIARHEVEYTVQMPYAHEPVTVRMWFAKLGGSSAELQYEIVRGDAVHVRAASTIVLIDQASGRPVRLPRAMRDAWTPYIGEPLAFHRR